MGKRLLIAAFCSAFVLSTLSVSAAQSKVSAGISVNQQGLSSFYFSISDYNKVPERQVVEIKRRGISDDEIAVVFFLAKQARVSTDEILKMRAKRWSYARIMSKLRIDPSVLYIKVDGEVRGKIYGRSYKHYHSKPPKHWKKIKLEDSDVINLVNLKFISDYYQYKPVEVIKMREAGKTFVIIDKDIKNERVKKVIIKKKYDKRKDRR